MNTFAYRKSAMFLREDKSLAARRSSRRHRHRRTCVFCRDKVDHIDYKNVDQLRSFLTDRGKIQPQRRTRLCAKHQRQLAVAIKRARHLALLPFVTQSRAGS